MRTASVLLFFGLSILVFSFKSAETRTASLLNAKKNHFKKDLLYTGGKPTTVYVDKSRIVGIVDFSYMDSGSLSTLLKDLGLELTPPRTFTFDHNYGPSPSAVHFVFVKKAGDNSIANGNSEELTVLREQFGRNFGPGIYDESGRISGVLSNAITIKFKSGTSKEKMKSILATFNTSRVIEMSPPYTFRLEFPNDFGYKVLDICDQFNKYESVEYIQNHIRHIIRHT